jgi:gamma-glutamylcyclotransferase
MVPDRFLYFAYGSNMFTRRLRERTPSAIVVGTGFVEAHRLSFDKVSSDGSGKCNIQTTNDPTERVYGVLFEIALVELVELDKAEGAGSGYTRGEVEVKSPGGVLSAVTYIADMTNPELTPYHWYKEFVVRGAIENQLPAAYIRRLQLTDSKADSNDNRRDKNEALFKK